MRVCVRGDLDPYEGDVLGLIQTLLKRGAEVHVEPLRVCAPLPAEVAVLLVQQPLDSYDLLLHMTEPTELGIRPTDKTDAVSVAWTAMHDFDEVYLDEYDLIVGYDTLSTERLSHDYAKKAHATVHAGYRTKDWPAAARDWDSGLSFCVSSHTLSHQSAVRAFADLRAEYPEDFADVELHVWGDELLYNKTLAPGIEYHTGYWSQDVVADFYAEQHVMIVPRCTGSQSTPALQFLSTGGTVIASRGRGATQWLSSTIGYPIDDGMQAIFPGDRDNREALTELKDAMLHVVRNRGEARRKGEQAANLIPDMCGWDKVLDRLFYAIAEKVPGRGQRLLHTARVAQEQARERKSR